MEFSKHPTDCNKLKQDLKKLAEIYSSSNEMLRKLPCKKAAVLVPIFDLNQVPHVILTKRSPKLRLHGGHVALPGGKVDPSDKDIYDSALREAEEEIGLDRKQVQILGMLPSLYSYIAQMVITPAVGYISDVHNTRFVKNEDEVESVFAVPLEIFIKSAYKRPASNLQSYLFHSESWDCQLYANTLLQSGVQEDKIEFFDYLIYSNKNTFKIWGISSWILICMSSLLFEEKYPAFVHVFWNHVWKHLYKVVPKSKL